MYKESLNAGVVASGLIAMILAASFSLGCAGRVQKRVLKSSPQTQDVVVNPPIETSKSIENLEETPETVQDPTEDPEEDPGVDGDDLSIPPVARLKPGVGVKNFRQIHATMAALTTIPMTQATVAAEYAILATQLPETNDIRAFLGSHQVAIAKLAVEYCDAMVTTQAALNVVLPGVNLAQTPAAGLNAAGREAISKALIERFWGVGLANLPNPSIATTALNKLTDDLLVGKDPNDATLMPNLVKALCTAVLASGPVTFQ